MAKALHLLDLRKKEKVFKIFLILFFVMGFSFGFRGEYVFPLFLIKNGFDAETIGLFLSLQILLARAHSTAINSEKLRKARTTYYSMMGWDKKGVPTRTKLEELNIAWSADEISAPN